MRILTAIATGMILTVGGGAAAVRAHYYEPPRRYAPPSTPWQAEQVVRQAYLDVLGREPDRSGLRQYADAVLNRGWSEEDVRQSLRSSPEYEERGRAAAMVRRAYRDVLGRDPDPAGMREYTARVLRDGWTERDLERALRSSDEYRRRY
jgi:hypothetical protein